MTQSSDAVWPPLSWWESLSPRDVRPLLLRKGFFTCSSRGGGLRPHRPHLCRCTHFPLSSIRLTESMFLGCLPSPSHFAGVHVRKDLLASSECIFGAHRCHVDVLCQGRSRSLFHFSKRSNQRPVANQGSSTLCFKRVPSLHRSPLWRAPRPFCMRLLACAKRDIFPALGRCSLFDVPSASRTAKEGVPASARQHRGCPSLHPMPAALKTPARIHGALKASAPCLSRPFPLFSGFVSPSLLKHGQTRSLP